MDLRKFKAELVKIAERVHPVMKVLNLEDAKQRQLQTVKCLKVAHKDMKHKRERLADSLRVHTTEMIHVKARLSFSGGSKKL